MPALVHYQGRKREVRATQARIELLAVRMLRALELEDAQLSLLLCDDQVMRVLNREHRGFDRPTDVLAFAMGEGQAIVSVAPALGDIVISLPTTARQARQHGVTADLEMCMLLAHGLLHLLGFDHATRTEERRMTARTHLLMAAALAERAPVEKHGGPVSGRSKRRPGQRPRSGE